MRRIDIARPLPPVLQGRWNQPAGLLREADLRARLALDLSRGDTFKAFAMLALPLFNIAMDGNDALVTTAPGAVFEGETRAGALPPAFNGARAWTER